MKKPEIFSEKLCVYGEAAEIILRHKGIDFVHTAIDPVEKEEWLTSLTPIKRLPILQAEGRYIFGTFALCEYLDEAYPHSIQPKKAIEKALNRSWIEFSVTLRNSVKLFTRASKNDLVACKETLLANLGQLNNALQNRPFFNGEKFSVVDAIYTPLLTRISLINQHFSENLLDEFGKLRAWYEELGSLEEVANTLTGEFRKDYVELLDTLKAH